MISSRNLVLILLFLSISFVQAQNQFVQGIVYEDKNKNGTQDQSESGIPEVLVSNQIQVVKTDKDGRYKLPARDDMTVFICKPAHYDLPKNENHIPQFYYKHQPEGSPGRLKFAGIKPTGTLPKSVNFALYKSKRKDQFRAIIVGDPQSRDSTEVGFFRDDVVAEMYGTDAEFYLALGDIAFNNLNIYYQYNQVVGKLGLPAYNVHGNHDMNFDVPDDHYAAETFKRIYGPTDYSFDYGDVHFIVMDNIEYNGWNTEENKKGGYRGYLSQQQLTWLKNDLAHIPEDNLIVISTHIPIVTTRSDGASINVVNREELFDVFRDRKHMLALSAHMHYIEHLRFNEAMDWLGKGTFYSINAGAGCGAWWSGPKDERGIPESYCLDGTPNGFYIFTFNGNQFNYEYIPSKFRRTHQMRISFPVGMVPSDSIAGKEIIVNIFNADPGTSVTCQLDDHQPLSMKQHRMSDPFIIQYVSQREHFPDWIDKPVENTHIWTLPLPQNLSTGTHTIKINAVDAKGNKYAGFSIFNVE
jgi:hypothetical protein